MAVEMCSYCGDPILDGQRFVRIIVIIEDNEDFTEFATRAYHAEVCASLVIAELVVSRKRWCFEEDWAGLRYYGL